MRKIENKTHNTYVVNGVDKHKPTSVAPEKMLKTIAKDTARVVSDKQSHLTDSLKTLLGEPYYSSDGFVLYNSDLIDGLKAIAECGLKLDLTLTSPPYNIGKEYEKVMPLQQYLMWCEEWMGLIYKATQDEGSFWLNLGYVEVERKGLCVPLSYLLWDKSPFYMLQEVVWQYGAGVAAKKRLSPRNEKWIYYVKDKDKYTFNLDDIRDPNVKYPNQKKNGKFRCNPLGKNPSDVWEFPKVTTGTKRSSKERTNHPAQFPLGVVERILLASSKPADLVLDPFAGSCSSGIAAMGLGRLFIGFELSEDYCNMAANRFELFKEARSQYAHSNSMLLLE